MNADFDKKLEHILTYAILRLDSDGPDIAIKSAMLQAIELYRTARKAPSFRAGMNSADAEGIHLRFL